MPQGKGTYGSKVGRPPKKAKYKYGGSVDPFSTRNPESVVSELIEEKADQAVIGETPTMNAQERSQTMPDTTEYNEGGKVRPEAVDVKANRARFEKIRKRYEEGRRGGQAQSKKQKEEQRVTSEKAKKRHLKQQSEYGKPKKKKKWEGQA